MNEKEYFISSLTEQANCIKCSRAVKGWCGWKIGHGALCNRCTMDLDANLCAALMAIHTMEAIGTARMLVQGEPLESPLTSAKGRQVHAET